MTPGPAVAALTHVRPFISSASLSEHGLLGLVAYSIAVPGCGTAGPCIIRWYECATTPRCCEQNGSIAVSSGVSVRYGHGSTTRGRPRRHGLPESQLPEAHPECRNAWLLRYENRTPTPVPLYEAKQGRRSG